MLCNNHVHIRACIPQPSRQTGCKASRLQDNQIAEQQFHNKSVAEQKDIPSMGQAVGTRQDTTSEARDYLITEANKVNV